MARPLTSRIGPRAESRRDVGSFQARLRCGLVVATSLMPLQASGADCPRFTSPSLVFAAGSGSKTPAIGEFNSDGIPDVVVTHESGVSILLGTGLGLFEPRLDLPARARWDVGVADLNEDAAADIVALAFPGDDSITVMIGHGDGTFEPADRRYVGGGLGAVSLEDLDHDGHVDLLGQGSQGLSVALGNGSGGFGPRTDYPAGGGGGEPQGIAVGRVNADTHADVVIANYAVGTISVLLGIGDGSFGPMTNFGTGLSQPAAVALGDLNGDGALDLAITSIFTNAVAVKLGTGNGAFGVSTTYATRPDCRGVAIADLDDDGARDVIVSNRGGTAAYLQILPGNGDGTLGARIEVAGGDELGTVVAGDLNQDGRADVAVACTSSNSLCVVYGREGPLTYDRFATGTTPVDIEMGDLDADGSQDIVTANRTGNSISVLLATGPGQYATNTDYATPASPHDVAIGDLDADGDVDLLTANRDAASVSVLRGNGDGNFAPRVDHATGPGPMALVLDHVNGDAALDVVTANHNAASLSVLLGNGDGTFAAPSSVPVGYWSRHLSAGDVNGDGSLDLVLTRSESLFVLLGNGDGTFATSIFTQSVPYVSESQIEDFDEDGVLDVAVAGFPDAVMPGNGDGTFDPPVPFEIRGSSWVTSDVNVDGHVDVVGSNGYGFVSVALGRGDGTFESPLDYGTTAGASGVTVGELNGDGRPDLAVCQGDHSVITLLSLGPCPTTGVSPDEPVRLTLDLAPARPNPTSQGARLAFRLTEARHVEADVVDVTGRTVRRLALGVRGEGAHDLAWDGRDDAGARVRSGVYFIRLRAGDRVTSRRVAVVH